MKAKCISGTLQQNDKVRYTLVTVDNDGVKLVPLESNVFYLESVNLTVGKTYDVTQSFQEVV